MGTICYLDELPVTGRRIFLRVDFNLPHEGGKIQDETRLTEALPTIRHLLGQGAKLILASHMGRPRGPDPRESLEGVATRLSILIDKDVIFPEDCVGDAVKKLAYNLKDGEVMLLENLRFHPEEEKNDPDFSKRLASIAEVYGTDAFGALHRAHASTAGMVSHFRDKGAGFLIRKELGFLEKLLRSPERPFYALLGGAKVSDKLGVIENLIKRVDGLLLGGALAYTFLRAQGVEVGRSRVDVDKIKTAGRILQAATERGIPVYLPVDHQVAPGMSESDQRAARITRNIKAEEMGLDIGPETVGRYGEILKQAKTLFWNGPMGWFEQPPFAQGTMAMAQAVAAGGAVSVVGGGESVTAVRQAGVAEKISHLSTGGGATLEYLEGRRLPGLEVLEIQ